MALTDLQLNDEALVIKNETVPGANTATRVATMLKDIIDNKINDDKISTDTAFAANSDDLVPSQKATKAFVIGSIPGSLPPSGLAGSGGGDLTGSYPNPSVKANIMKTGAVQEVTAAKVFFENTLIVRESSGLDSELALNYQSGAVLTGVVTFPDIDTLPSATVQYVETLPTSLPPSGAAGGVLTGTYPASLGLANNAVTTVTIADANVTKAKLASTVLPKRYIALISQDNAVAAGVPQATVIFSEFTGAITFSKVGTGDYRVTSAGSEFTVGKTIAKIYKGTYSTPVSFFGASFVSPLCNIQTFNLTGVPTDGLLLNTLLEIEVYS